MGSLRIGCALWTLGATPDVATLRRNMEVVAEIGCTSVQPWIVNFEYTPCILDPEVGTARDRREVVRAAKELGLTFSGFCAQLKGAMTYGGLEEEDGLEWRIAKTKQAITTAAELGGPVVTTHAGIMPEDVTAPNYQTLLRSVGEIARHAEGEGVFLALETGQEKAEDLLQFVETVGNPYLKVNYDPCNLMQFGSRRTRSRVWRSSRITSSTRMLRTGIRRRGGRPVGKASCHGTNTLLRSRPSDTTACTRSRTRPVLRTCSARSARATHS